MQVVQDGLNTTSGSHVFETPDDIIINSQIYDKSNMEPVPFCFFNMNALNNKNLLLHEVNIVEYPGVNIAKENDYKYYIQDNQDLSSFYCLTEIGATDTNQRFNKIKKIDGKWNVVGSISPDSGYRWNYNVDFTYLHYKLLGQTNDYVVLAQITKNAAFPDYEGMIGKDFTYGNAGNQTQTLGDLTYNNNGYMSRNFFCGNQLSYISINKKDLSVKTLPVTTQQNLGVFLIKETNNCVYICENLSGMIKIVKYVPDANVRQEFFAYDTYQYTQSMGLSNIILFNDKYYTLVGNSSNYYFLQLTIDFDKETVSKSTIKLPTSFPLHNATNRTDGLDSCWLLYDLKNIDNKYISISSHDQSNAVRYYQYQTKWGGSWGNTWASTWLNTLSQTSLSSLGWHRFGLFKYNNNSFEFKGLIKPNAEIQHVYGIIYYNQYTPIFLLNTGIVGYKLNFETEKYENILNIPGNFYTIGTDEIGNFYTFDSNNKCTVYNDFTIVELNTKFEKEQYSYDDAYIDTYITIYAKNFLLEYSKTKVKITLTGACKFKENDKDSIITYTDSSGEINIPVIVYGSGTMYCHVEEVS